MEPPFRTKERITGALYAMPVILFISFFCNIFVTLIILTYLCIRNVTKGICNILIILINEI